MHVVIIVQENYRPFNRRGASEQHTLSSIDLSLTGILAWHGPTRLQARRMLTEKPHGLIDLNMTTVYRCAGNLQTCAPINARQMVNHACSLSQMFTLHHSEMFNVEASLIVLIVLLPI